MSSVGGAEFWGWPLVAISVGAMVLVIAELGVEVPVRRQHVPVADDPGRQAGRLVDGLGLRRRAVSAA